MLFEQACQVENKFSFGDISVTAFQQLTQLQSRLTEETSNNMDNKKEESMSSHKQLVSDIERQSVRVRINLYKQMKEQLLSQMNLYQRLGKEELAKLISESI